MSNPRIAYTPDSGATPEAEISVLADVYSFVMRCAEEKKKGGPATAHDDRKGVKVDPATASVP